MRRGTSICTSPIFALVMCCSSPRTNAASNDNRAASNDLVVTTKWLGEYVPLLSYFKPVDVHVVDVTVTDCTLRWSLARMFKGVADSVRRLQPYNHFAVALSTVQLDGVLVHPAKWFTDTVWRVGIPTTVVDSANQPIEQSLYFEDSLSAFRVRRAVYHIAELCGAKKDPF